MRLPLSLAVSALVSLGLGSTTLRAQDATAAAEPTPQAQLVEVKLADIGGEPLQAAPPFETAPPNFRQSLLRLRQIADDPAVQGIRLYADNGLDAAQGQEVLRELRGIKNAGKKIVCYAESLDRGTLTYASLADHLVLPPSGQVMLQGPVAEALYMKDLLAKLGVKFEVLHIGEFKTAFEDFARDSMSDAQRETIQAILEEYYRQSVDAISRNRGVSRLLVEALFDQWLVSPGTLLEAGIIDAIGYQDEFDAQVKTLFGGEVEEIDDYGQDEKQDLEKLMGNPLAFFSALPDLLEPKKKPLPDGPKIAVVYAEGTIMPGKSMSAFGGAVLGSDTIVEALDEARENEDVKAVVFRVNSPGGSALASDMIWRAVERCKEVKPVIASMGGVAGSGGYWISMGCHKILAEPATITGSIGVVSAVPNLAGTMDLLGIKVEVVGAGPRVEDLASMRGPSEFMKSTLTAWMKEVYDTFVAKVAAGRGMDPAAVEPNARGRAWTGRAAKDLGLVDALGGLDEAIVVACTMAGLQPSSTPVVELPEPPDFFAQLEEMLGGFTTTAVPLGELGAALHAAGLDEVIPTLQALSTRLRNGHQDMIQCVVPFHLNVR